MLYSRERLAIRQSSFRGVVRDHRDRKKAFMSGAGRSRRIGFNRAICKPGTNATCRMQPNLRLRSASD